VTERRGRKGFLLLEDGALFRGSLFGGDEPTVAEIVFTTNMTGYQEVFTDPSYRGQTVVMTAPMIGNYGMNAADPESSQPQIAGVIAREFSRTYSNWRAEGDLLTWLEAGQVPALEEVDTRRLTRHLRTLGVMRGVIAAGTEPSREVLAALDACPSMEGLDLASRVSTREQYSWGNPDASYHIVAYDFGIKRNILRLFAEHDCRVTVVPAETSAAAALALEPNGVFLSNGPGDPAAVSYAPEAVREIAADGVPIFGICLGHQILGLTYGAQTVKMPYGHRGGNHPVKDIATGHVLIHRAESRLCRGGNRDRDPWRARPRGHARELERRHCGRGSGTATNRSSRCSITRRPRQGRTTAARCSTPSWIPSVPTPREVTQTLDT
jgi:carbamoyl-phosphate synthase small subunit